MKNFKCELINNGIVIKRFFRDGESIGDVLDGLEMFIWPDGYWSVEEA